MNKSKLIMSFFMALSMILVPILFIAFIMLVVFSPVAAMVLLVVAAFTYFWVDAYNFL